MAGASPGFDCTAVDLVILLTAEYVTSYVSSLPEKAHYRLQENTFNFISKTAECY